MPLGPLLERLRRLTYPWATGVVLQTRQGCRWLAECCPGAAGYVIANPVVYPLPDGRPAVSPAALLDESRQVLLAVGRLGTEKGFYNLLDAFASLAGRFPQWDLVILGEGEERGGLEAQRHALGLDGRVYLPGRVGNVGDWYHRADLYVMSSRFEGFPNTLLEALAHGLPVVSMDCDTGPKDIIRHGTDGLLIDPQSGAGGWLCHPSIYSTLEPARRRMAKAAVAVRDRFSMQRIGALWDQALRLAAE